MTRRFLTAFAVLAAISLGAPGIGRAQAFKVEKFDIKGEGGTDYIYADPVGRRLYITRGATQAQPATDTRPDVPAVEKRLTIFDLDTLESVGVIPGVGGNGATVCPKTGHGFTSDHPKPSMFDVKTMKLIKTIDVPERFTPTASTVTRLAIASTSAAIRRRACWWWTRRTAPCSGPSCSS